MKLFFETSGQAVSFLSAVPAGFLLCCCLCVGKANGLWRMFLDLLILVLGAFVLFWLFVVCFSMELRFYHLLGVLSGALLCMTGTIPAVRNLSAYCKKKTNRVFSRNQE